MAARPLSAGGCKVYLRLLALLVALMLAGCGLVQRAQFQQKATELRAQSDAAMAECNSRLPAGVPSHAVGRAQCVNQALGILRPIMPFPDLWDVYMATHLAIAEQVQAGKMSVTQANVVLTEKRSALTAEEQRRLLANRSVTAQENIAAASLEAAGPRSCT